RHTWLIIACWRCMARALWGACRGSNVAIGKRLSSQATAATATISATVRISQNAAGMVARNTVATSGVMAMAVLSDRFARARYRPRRCIGAIAAARDVMVGARMISAIVASSI